jgi:phosphoenolpyruvate---glycerone phosphotransferase subunit DhaL
MKDRVTRDDWFRMITGAAVRIREQHLWLSQLDSAAGDGDHGATLWRAVPCLEGVFSPGKSADLKSSFYQAGWNVLGADGGASTSLLGTLFLGMYDAVAADSSSLDCSGLANLFRAGLAAVQRQTKAKPGDQTMMDALTPAVESLQVDAAGGKGIESTLEEAANAASAGAAATKDLTARYGRARFLGEKTRGHQDPGATSVALMFEGFYRGLAELEGEGNHA